MRNIRHILAPWLAALVLSACAVAPTSHGPADGTASPDQSPSRPAAVPAFDWTPLTQSLATLSAAHGVEVSQNPSGGLRLIIPAADGFESGKAQVRPELAASLNAIAPILGAHPTVHAEILGHTDSIGREGYNMLLSRQRARAVRDLLMAQGIDAGRLSADGRGETEPVADNDTPEGRSKNRRVEIRLFVPH